MKKDQKYYLIASGRISGTYADSFHKISHDGKVGYYFSDKLEPAAATTMLLDLNRHRAVLLAELDNLEEAEKILKKVLEKPKKKTSKKSK